MTSTLKVCEPARYKTWGLTVDRRDLPGEFVVYGYPNEGHRHTEPCWEIARVPYIEPSDAAVSALIQLAGMSDGTARQLLNQLTAKMASHRWTSHSVQE